MVLVTNFIINQEEIAKDCENIDKPIMQCHGTCQLAKSLEQEEDKKPDPTITHAEVIIVFYQQKVQPKSEWIAGSEISEPTLFFYEEQLSSGFEQSIDHPPS